MLPQLGENQVQDEATSCVRSAEDAELFRRAYES